MSNEDDAFEVSFISVRDCRVVAWVVGDARVIHPPPELRDLDGLRRWYAAAHGEKGAAVFLSVRKNRDHPTAGNRGGIYVVDGIIGVTGEAGA